jgi:ATP adenylyltransferase
MQNENLWAPWRMAYLQGLTDNPTEAGPTSELAAKLASETQASKPSESEAKACFICEAAKCQQGSDKASEKLVLLNDDRGLLLLNKYPYTNGHLLICPKDHVGQLGDLSADQRANLMELTALAEQLLNTAINPQGLNVGINLGAAAGAGIPGHLHIHVLPRWVGDTNFMQAVGQIRVIPQALDQSYDHLAAVLAKLETLGD